MRNPFGSRSAPTAGTGSPWRSPADLLAVFPAMLVAFSVLAAVYPPRSGPLALAMIFEPHLFIVAFVVLAPIALLARARVLGAMLLVALVAGGGLFGSEWVSLPGSGASRPDLSVMNWNLQYGVRTPADTARLLEGATADVVALQELEPAASAAIEADATIVAHYPYRTMEPRIGAVGLAILSHFPIANVDLSDLPVSLQLTVQTPRGPVTVINGHPTRTVFETFSRLKLPVLLRPWNRDAAIASLLGRIDKGLAAGERLLVLGDFNTSPSEAEYARIAKGLRDTHVQVGEGPGWTWRPSRFAFLPIGFLRIDLQLTAGAIVPVSTSVDCSLRGDHCRLFGNYEIDR